MRLIINRGRKLTSIKDGNISYRLATNKFDEIVGTSNDAFPERTEPIEADSDIESIRIDEDYSCPNFEIEMNDKLFNFSDFIQFSDMDARLLASSVLKASKYQLSNKYLASICMQYYLYAKYDAIFTTATVSFDSTLSLGYTNLYKMGRDTHNMIQIVPGGRDGSQLIRIDINWLAIDDTNDDNHIDNITRKAYDMIVKRLKYHYFIDKKGNKYFVNFLSYEEFSKLLLRRLISMYSIGGNNLIQIHLHKLLEEWLTELVTEELELVDANGQIVYKTVSEVLPNSLVRELRKYGKNGLMIQKSGKKLKLVHILQQVFMTQKTGNANQ